jgi:trans-aconitate 2-methyltransferase
MNPASTENGGPFRWDANDYHRSASAQTGWGREVHDRLGLCGDERVIDLGCGDGRLTAELAARVPRGSVTGLDADADMIRFARKNHARENVSYVLGDARRFELGRRVDLVVSTATLHWVREQVEVLASCRTHLAPGGRIHFQMGGRGNCAGILAVAEEIASDPRWATFLQPFASPWQFQGPEEYRPLLPRCGFRPLRAELLARDMVHDHAEGLRAWMRTTWMPVLARVPERLRASLVEAIASRYLALRPPDADGRTHVDVVRFEVEAVAL